DTITAQGPKSFTIKLKEPTGLLIFALGKPASNVPFIMPKRVAETDPNSQISDFTGSGPFVFKTDEWKPGDKAVYVKFDKYKPRAEPSSGLSGGKVAKVDRVEWLAISDQQQAVNALLGGEIDVIEAPSHDLLPLPTGDSNIKLVDWHPIGNPDYYKVCKAMFVCGTALESTKGMDGLLESNFAKSKELLKEANYDGAPIVLLHSTDLQVLTNLAPVAKSLLEKGGFKVDMQ